METSKEDLCSSPMVITASYAKVITFWNPSNSSVIRSLAHPHSQVNSLLVWKNFVVAAGNPDIPFYSIDSLNIIPDVCYMGHKDSVTGIAFEREGKWMATSSDDKTIKIWSLNASGYQRSFNLGSQINSLDLHPNQSEIICGCQDGMIRVIDLVKGDVITVIPQSLENYTIQSVSVSPDGKFLASGDDSGHISIRHIPSNTASLIRSDTIREIGAHDSYILKCIFSPDGETLASCSSDTSIKLWKTKGWKLDKTLHGHREWVWDCCFSVDSKYLLSGSSDEMAMLWDVPSGTNVRLYRSERSGAISTVALYDFQK